MTTKLTQYGFENIFRILSSEHFQNGTYELEHMMINNEPRKLSAQLSLSKQNIIFSLELKRGEYESEILELAIEKIFVCRTADEFNEQIDLYILNNCDDCFKTVNNSAGFEEGCFCKKLIGVPLQCSVCLEMKPNYQYITLENCSHEFCRKCLNELVKDYLKRIEQAKNSGNMFNNEICHLICPVCRTHIKSHQSMTPSFVIPPQHYLFETTFTVPY